MSNHKINKMHIYSIGELINSNEEDAPRPLFKKSRLLTISGEDLIGRGVRTLSAIWRNNDIMSRFEDGALIHVYFSTLTEDDVLGEMKLISKQTKVNKTKQPVTEGLNDEQSFVNQEINAPKANNHTEQKLLDQLISETASVRTENALLNEQLRQKDQKYLDKITEYQKTINDLEVEVTKLQVKNEALEGILENYSKNGGGGLADNGSQVMETISGLLQAVLPIVQPAITNFINKKSGMSAPATNPMPAPVQAIPPAIEY